MKRGSQSTISWPLPFVVAAVGFIVVLQLRDSTPVMPTAPEALASGTGVIRAPHREAPASAPERREFTPLVSGDEPPNPRAIRAKTSERTNAIDAVISRQISIADGKLMGMRLSPGNADKAELFERLGLRTGDMVTAIDGISLDDPRRAEELWRDASARASANLTVERDGQVLGVSPYFDDIAVPNPLSPDEG